MRFVQVTITTFAVASRLVALATAIPLPNWEAGGFAIPLTRHSSLLNSSETIDIRDAISSHGKSIEEKILSGLDNYETNTGSMHPFAVKQSESRLGRRGASVPLTSHQNSVWMADISIGTPPKTFKVHIDTGSADMWVLQTGCQCSGISADRDFWDPNLSKSAKTNSKWWPWWSSFKLTYADGTIVKGNRYTDNVTIGGFTADPQTFGSVTSYTFPFPERANVNGLLGLAFPSVSQFLASPLFESLLTQKRVINPTISFKLTSSGAEMYIGGANSMLYKGNIAYTRITNTGLWQVSMDDVRVNGIKVLEDVATILDTGANYIFGDWNQVAELYRPLGAEVVDQEGYGLYYLPCDSFPTMSLTFGGTTFEIPPDVLNIQPVTTGSPNCFSAIIARRAPYAFWSIGVPFLQSVYSVFDYGTLQVGFAELA